MKKISVLIPVYNSEKTLHELCSALIRALGLGTNLEIMLVNDGSMDRSWQICKGRCNDYPDIVRYLELSRNFGEHNAQMAGLNYVTGYYCVMMDDDLQNPPEEAVKPLLS